MWNDSQSLDKQRKSKSEKVAKQLLPYPINTATVNKERESKSKNIANQLLPSPMKTLVPRRLSFKSVDQAHDLLNPQRDFEELSEVGPPGQACRLTYTNLVGQLHLWRKGPCLQINQSAADNDALLFVFAAAGNFCFCSFAQSWALLKARAPFEKDSKLLVMTNVSSGVM